MMSDLLPLECVVGSDFIENVVLYDRDDSPIRSYLGGETLAIELSTGDDQAPIPLTSSSVAWSDVTTGKLTITLTRADTATFTPGDYYLYLSITSAGIVLKRPIVLLTVIPAPGTATALSTYNSLDDMRRVASWIEHLTPSNPNTQANWSEARHQARIDIDTLIISRARVAFEDQLRRHPPVAVSDPITLTTGVDAGPDWGLSTIPDTSLRDHLDVIQGHLDNDYLIRDADMVEAAALLSVYRACRGQFGTARGTEVTYHMLGIQCRQTAMGLLRGWVARIDTDDDGVANIEIGR